MLYSKLALLTTLISVAVSMPQDATNIEANRVFLQNGEKNTFIEETKTMGVDMKNKNVIKEDLGDRIAELEVNEALHHRHHPHGFEVFNEEVIVGDEELAHEELLEERLREEDQLHFIEDLARIEEGGDHITIKNE
ncbi:hypothetical protein CONCODRAFT_5946 [Conidiobolus coronatus NRRL 28638]|uniref:Uncharacterized protein n=1 Tax=Conidiobolus coronatus (strain ATCC 28846 / CBS 209.66 / NRRL 28638) TaxID=796925 RepID=A0A137P8S2_CONC2|nr:hypothetical protein CONCODRAFT_5946 [Conidiobolus coronatus NRRL 28638]|eukprot:KXN71408.1 hypothetical protein CONCODRAFT_5946 [Conidiobolus coronatus NRRL 28638]